VLRVFSKSFVMLKVSGNLVMLGRKPFQSKVLSAIEGGMFKARGFLTICQLLLLNQIFLNCSGMIT
jgi:hypothetical protein